MSATHGLASTYRSQRYACRCEACCAANTERTRQETASRRERIVADPSLAPHGLWTTYTNWQCRCDQCKAAAVIANATARARRHAATERAS